MGKTHLALALGYKAAEEGYKVSFVTMSGLIQLLKTKEISRKSKLRLNRIYASAVVIIDEIGYLPIDHKEASLFFHLISELHEQSSIILTSNKGFEDWPELFGDTEMVTAALDRLMHHCDVIRMDGKSYRQSIFHFLLSIYSSSPSPAATPFSPRRLHTLPSLHQRRLPDGME